jgi:hypothetical protein
MFHTSYKARRAILKSFNKMNNKIRKVRNIEKLVDFLNTGDKPMSEFFLNMKKYNKTPEIYRSLTFIYNSINREYTKYYISFDGHHLLYDESIPENKWSIITSDNEDDYPIEQHCQGCIGHGLDDSFCLNSGNKILCDTCKSI